MKSDREQAKINLSLIKNFIRNGNKKIEDEDLSFISIIHKVASTLSYELHKQAELENTLEAYRKANPFAIVEDITKNKNYDA